MKTKDLYDATIHYDRADSISEGVFKSHPSAELRSGDVLLAIVGQGSINKCNVFEPQDGTQFIFTRALGLIRPSPDQLNPYFLKLFLQSAIGKGLIDAGIGGTSGQQVVTTTHLKALQIPLPPLEEQQRIVAVLDEVLGDLARARANAEANLQNARELFESVLDAVFFDYPDHWAASNLGSVCKFVGGSQPPKSNFEYSPGPGLVRLIQIRDYKSDRNFVFVPEGLARRFCDEDDIMIGRYGPPLFQILRGIKGAYNVALMKAVPDPSLISKDFLYYFLRNGRILRYINDASSRAAGQIGLNKATLEPYPIAFPSASEQLGVTQRLDHASAECDLLVEQYLRKVQDIDDLRQSLLKKAFAGELT